MYVCSRTTGKDCHSPLKCFERVTQERRENVFEGFWGVGDWTTQNFFYYSCRCSCCSEIFNKSNCLEKSKKSNSNKLCHRFIHYQSPREQIWVALVHILKKLYEVAVTELHPLLLLFVFTRS